MKTMPKTIFGTLLLLVIAIFTYTSCDSEKIDLLEPPIIKPEPGIASNVVNSETGEPISNVTVTFNNKVTRTDNDGEFSIEIEKQPGEYVLSAEAEGYLTCPVLVQINETHTMMNSIFLQKLGTEHTIGREGGEITEQFDDGRTFRLIIPENCFSEPTKIWLTPVEGPEAGTIIDDLFPLATVDIKIENEATPLLPMKLQIPAAFTLTNDDILFLSRVNEDYQSTTTFTQDPILQNEGNTIQVSITSHGKYILSGVDLYVEEEELPDSETEEEEIVVTDKVIKTLIPANSTEFTIETDDVEPTYANFITALQEQVYGYKYDQDNIQTIYLSYKPDLTPSEKVTNSTGYPFWVYYKCPSFVFLWIGPIRCYEDGYFLVVKCRLIRRICKASLRFNTPYGYIIVHYRKRIYILKCRAKCVHQSGFGV